VAFFIASNDFSKNCQPKSLILDTLAPTLKGGVSLKAPLGVWGWQKSLTFSQTTFSDSSFAMQ
jgi:hypothetical protein